MIINEQINGYCEQCKQTATHSNLFLCKGKMLCQSCWMTETRGNTIFFDETKYPRKRDSKGNIMIKNGDDKNE